MANGCWGRRGLFSGALNRQKNKNEKGQEHYAGPLEGKRNIRELNGKSGIKQSTWPLNEGEPSSRCTEGKQTGPRGGVGCGLIVLFASAGFALKLLMYVQNT